MGKITKLAILLIFIAACLSVSRGHAFTYAYDDGTGEGAWGLVGTGINVNIIWANRFVVVPGAELITSISAAFGPPTNVTFNGTPIPNLDGAPVTASLWSDPNGDGSPNDAVLLSSVGGTVGNYYTDVFNIYDIPDTVVSGSFFIALSLVDPGNAYPVRFDAQSTASESWFGLNTNDLSQNVGSLSPTSTGGTLMVRAEAGPATTVPEPATMLLLGSGLIGLAGYGRKKFFKK